MPKQFLLLRLSIAKKSTIRDFLDGRVRAFVAGLMQFFAYSIAKELGCDIDKPRNLAKAVTVE